MATFGFDTVKPSRHILKNAVPAALATVLRQLSPLLDNNVWLVGGTALAAYYFAHRRSDDLDLFAADDVALGRAVTAVRSLAGHGLLLKNESRSPLYYHADAELSGHRFTIDIVVDATVHRVGGAVPTDDGICVANLDTLFAMKAAALVSRASEKDLFDLEHLLGLLKTWDVDVLIRAGQTIDAGLDAETLLISLKGAFLKEGACGFLMDTAKITPRQAFKTITALRETLVTQLLAIARQRTDTPLVQALKASVKDLKKS
jgi:hypothetical protein